MSNPKQAIIQCKLIFKWKTGASKVRKHKLSFHFCLNPKLIRSIRHSLLPILITCIYMAALVGISELSPAYAQPLY